MFFLFLLIFALNSSSMCNPSKNCTYTFYVEGCLHFFSCGCNSTQLIETTDKRSLTFILYPPQATTATVEESILELYFKPFNYNEYRTLVLVTYQAQLNIFDFSFFP